MTTGPHDPPRPAMPAAFLAHGSPTNALESNPHTLAWRGFGERAPRPRAVLVVSAHWYVPTLAVTAGAHPRTIHDFRGFPQALFDLAYPAPGDPALAAEVAQLLQPLPVGLDHDRGLDHGAWGVLVHVLPHADVPVVQLSIDARREPAFHFDLGRRLAPLRARDVLIVASGNVVHDLGSLDWGKPTAGFDWARRFDDAARAVMTTRPGDAVALCAHPDYARAAPTPEHFLPLLYLAGLASAAGRAATVIDAGYAYGSLSMTSYALDG
jgi:4,5-DOPA dioxygenase extradiol